MSKSAQRDKKAKCALKVHAVQLNKQVFVKLFPMPYIIL